MKFEPGQSGNPFGRPRGSRNKASIIAEQLLEGEIEAIGYSLEEGSSAKVGGWGKDDHLGTARAAQLGRIHAEEASRKDRNGRKDIGGQRGWQTCPQLTIR